MLSMSAALRHNSLTQYEHAFNKTGKDIPGNPLETVR
jgi:hypothetical protein